MRKDAVYSGKTNQGLYETFYTERKPSEWFFFDLGKRTWWENEERWMNEKGSAKFPVEQWPNRKYINIRK